MHVHVRARTHTHCTHQPMLMKYLFSYSLFGLTSPFVALHPCSPCGAGHLVHPMDAVHQAILPPGKAQEEAQGRGERSNIMVARLGM